MENTNSSDVLMILPRKTIHHPSALHEGWETDEDPVGLSILVDNQPAARACIENEGDFGLQRPALKVQDGAAQDQDLFEAIVSRLAMVYDQLPMRYPLYIRFHSNQLELIAKASRMGFVPYFGQWEEKTFDQSEEDWTKVTDSLRKVFPQGLACEQ